MIFHFLNGVRKEKKKMEKEKETETEKKKKKQGEKEVFQFYIYKLPIDRPAAVTGILATIGNLILHEGSQRLETAYALNGLKTNRRISESDLTKVLDNE